MARVLVALVFAAACSCVTAVQYRIDESFPADRAALLGARITAVAVDPRPEHALVHVAVRAANFTQPILAFSQLTGRIVATWGAAAVARDPATPHDWGVHGMAAAVPASERPDATPLMWVTNVVDATVRAVPILSTTSSGAIIIGTPNTPGNGTEPLQFGSVADVAPSAGVLFIADGDGGINNRVSAWIGPDHQPLFIAGSSTAGTAPGQFNSPHSVAYHAASKTLFVADRGNNRTQQLDAGTGVPLGEWTCMRPGTPWGLRILARDNLLFQADGNSNSVSIFSLVHASPSGPGPCALLQTISIPHALCDTPHEMAVDESTGNVYLACVQPDAPGLVRLVPDRK
jgi:DNA-binding beta-propeller fold protein YncE